MIPSHFNPNGAWEQSFLRWLGDQPDTRAALPDSLTLGEISGDGILRVNPQPVQPHYRTLEQADAELDELLARNIAKLPKPDAK